MNIKSYIIALPIYLTPLLNAQAINWADFESAIGDNIALGETVITWSDKLTHTNIQLGSGSFDLSTTGRRNAGGDHSSGLYGSYSPNVSSGYASGNTFTRYLQEHSDGIGTDPDAVATKVTISNFLGLDTRNVLFAVGGLDSRAKILAFNGTNQVELKIAFHLEKSP